MQRILSPRVAEYYDEYWDFEAKRWVRQPDDEVAWLSDRKRYVVVVAPNVPVKSVRFVKRPFDQPNASWDEFCRSKPGERWAEGSLGLGNWLWAAEVTLADGRVLLPPK